MDDIYLSFKKDILSSNISYHSSCYKTLLNKYKLEGFKDSYYIKLCLSFYGLKNVRLCLTYHLHTLIIQ